MAANERTILSHSHQETQDFGAELGRQLQLGDLLAFYGDLGTGKTCMVQGICRGLGVEDWVNSPTFILINEYEGWRDNLTLPVYHFDLYRLTSAAELEDLGAEENFYGQGICLIEWADRATGLLPPNHREVLLEYVDADKRQITVRTRSP